MNFVDVAQLAVFLGPHPARGHRAGLVLPQTSVDLKNFNQNPKPQGEWASIDGSDTIPEQLGQELTSPR
jgi:hypothetical protein